MQKIFTKYLCFIMSIALLAILLLNYQLQGRGTQTRMLEGSKLKLQQIAQTLSSNDHELQNLTSSLKEDYLTRASAFAYIINQNPDVLNSQKELDKIKTLLNVDELHVINEHGILFAGTVPKYFGMDFRSTRQTAEFLPILKDPQSYLVQDLQPNGAEEKIFQYVGVARKDKTGIVQVGLEPRRLMIAQARNELPYIFSRLPVDAGSTIFAVDAQSGEILADTNPAYIGKNVSDFGAEEDFNENYSSGGFKTLDGVRKFYYLEQQDNLILGISLAETALYSNRFEQMLLISLYLLITFIIVIIAINRLLKKQIVNGVHNIMEDLTHITDGNLETVVKVENNPEFEQLSSGINKMVGSILDATVKISRTIELVDVPIGVFEFHDDMSWVMATNRLRQILMLTESEAETLYQSKELFIDRLRSYMSNPEGDEIYKISSQPDKWVKIHMFSDPTGTFGVVTDVTKDMYEKRMIEHERDYDSLTGLCNLSKFKQLIRNLLERRDDLKKAGLLMLDLDYFKRVNDEYGHDWGDSYLRFTAQRLEGFAGEHGIAARRSGDEFCLFLYGFDTCDEVLERINGFYSNLASDKIKFPDGSEKSLQMSMGLAWLNGGLVNYEELLRAADIALYDAKNSGRGTCKQYKP